VNRLPLSWTFVLALSLTTGCPSAESAKTPDVSASPSPSVHIAGPGPSPAEATTPSPASTNTGPALPSHPLPEEGRAGTDFLRSIKIQVGSKPLDVWIAEREPQRRLGLMHVTDMDEERGMLFVYPQAGYRSFWMRNTKIPLSLAYISADGRIAQILDMEPMTRVSHPSKATIRLVLEVNQGWFKRHGITVGAHIPGISKLPGYP
jgi:uncharacterized membrane protein (UPF0127 family)